MRAFGLGIAIVSLSLAVGGTANAAPSKCDAAITKAAGKKVYCKAKVHSTAQKKGTTPDTVKLGKCETKFDKACQKAQTKGDCMVQAGSCPAIEGTADTCVATLILSASPSGAFLE